jgi:hypothetical protein
MGMSMIWSIVIVMVVYSIVCVSHCDGLLLGTRMLLKLSRISPCREVYGDHPTTANVG